jgi:hypothetical protein
MSAKTFDELWKRRKQPTELKDLRVSRVSLVDRGAGEDCGIVLFKRAADDTPAARLEELKRRVNRLKVEQDGLRQVIDAALERARNTAKKRNEGKVVQMPTTATIEKCCQAVNDGDVDRFVISDYLGVLERHAKSIQRPGESYYEALTRAEETPEGQLLKIGIDNADEPEPSVTVTKAEPGAWEQLLKSAHEIQARNASLSESEALDLACQHNPELYAQYRAEEYFGPGGEAA